MKNMDATSSILDYLLKMLNVCNHIAHLDRLINIKIFNNINLLTTIRYI